MSAKCRSCGKPIVWAQVKVTGSRIPLDPEPVKGGNIRLLDRPWVEVLSGKNLDRATDERMFVTHYATCPDAESWRKNR